MLIVLALEVRREAIQSFKSDTRVIQNQFSMLTDEVRNIKTSMTNFARHPLDETLSQLVAPLAAIVIRSLTKKRSSGKSGLALSLAKHDVLLDALTASQHPNNQKLVMNCPIRYLFPCIF